MARDSIGLARYMLSPVRLSVWLSVDHTGDQSKRLKLRLWTRKPCCRKETARCRRCSSSVQSSPCIHYKFKSTQAFESSGFRQSSKHIGANQNLTQKWRLNSARSQWKCSALILYHNFGVNFVNVSTTYTVADSKYSADHDPKLHFPRLYAGHAPCVNILYRREEISEKK